MAKDNKNGRLPGVTRKMVTFALATALLLPAFSVKAADGKTEVNLGVTEVTDSSVSYEVPLYCTLAVVDRGDKREVVTPTNYYISDTGKNKEKQLAVTGLAVSTVQKGTWNLKTQGEIENQNATAKFIKLSVGEVDLKEVNLQDEKKLTTLDLQANENSFYNKNENKYKIIGKKLSIPITGQVSQNYKITSSQPTTAQFRLYYTVSVLDNLGNVKGTWSYEGPDAKGNPIVQVGGSK